MDKTEDSCFSLNAENKSDYSGGLFLKNTTVSSFHTGVTMGFNACFKAKATSFVWLKGGSAILARNPRSLFLEEGCIFRCESNGIQIKLDNMSRATENVNKRNKIVIRSTRVT